MNRGIESPMEWEYENKKGPIDTRSPFLARQNQQQRSFESPSKSGNVPQTATTRSMFNMNSPTKTPQAPPFRNPSFSKSFTTPRKPFDADLFSEASGAESSPADNADAEDTPELPKVKNMALFDSSPRHKPPIFGRFGKNFTGTSAGRGELQRGKFATAVVKQRKRKRLERDYGLPSNSSDDSRDNSRPASAHRKGKNEPTKGWFGRFLDGLVDRPTLPYILSYYPQLLLNYFLVFGVIYTLWIFFRAIRSDVDAASEAAYSAILAEMGECSQHFVDNRCGDGKRLPAMRKLCDNWELCMNRDPSQVGRARVSAHTFAEIFNSFVEPISWKAMAFCTMLLVVCITVNNMAFGLYRSKSTHPPPAPYNQPDYQWGPVPHPTPHRDQQLHGNQPNDNPFPAIMPSATPGRGRSPQKKYF